MKEAMLYEKLPENRVRCHLCAHHCQIGDGKKGICQVRENRDSNSHYENDYHYFTNLSSIKPNSFVLRLNFAVKFLI